MQKYDAIEWWKYFNYESTTGALTWAVKRPGRACVLGAEAGGVRADGLYRSVQLMQKRYLVHRIVWVMARGPIPAGMCIDHIDGNGLNNAITNLRVVTLSENQRNARLSHNNKTGIHGVHPLKGGYSVECAGAYVGYFKSFFDACCARKSAEGKGNFHKNHGRTANAQNS